MLHNKRENPLWENFDKILEILTRHDVTISLGDGLRPGSLADGSDISQISELVNIAELVIRARRAGVQVMVEGPGHLPLNQVEMNIKLQKELCHGAPFYVLGPVTTDIAPGYDHLTSAIGGALAAFHGADFLCYVTPSEHLGLPEITDVREGVIYSKIAAHVADLARGSRRAWEMDIAMAKARAALDWKKQKELAIDPEKFVSFRNQHPTSTDACSMCSDLCVFKILEDFTKECRQN
jgi:phosphomethylpyrimidine synthase